MIRKNWGRNWIFEAVPFVATGEKEDRRAEWCVNRNICRAFATLHLGVVLMCMCGSLLGSPIKNWSLHFIQFCAIKSVTIVKQLSRRYQQAGHDYFVRGKSAKAVSKIYGQIFKCNKFPPTDSAWSQLWIILSKFSAFVLRKWTLLQRPRKMNRKAGCTFSYI